MWLSPASEASIQGRNNPFLSAGYSSSTLLFYHQGMSVTLREAQANLSKKATYKAAPSPFLIWLTENPASPLALPGAISLEKHDYVHCLLGKNLKPEGEAFVIGFTMGCDRKINAFHLWLFKMISCYCYPKKYRFNAMKHWVMFNRGYRLARLSHVKDLEKFDFDVWLDKPLASLRKTFFAPYAASIKA
jgi:hypothetical protein